MWERSLFILEHYLCIHLKRLQKTTKLLSKDDYGSLTDHTSGKFHLYCVQVNFNTNICGILFCFCYTSTLAMKMPELQHFTPYLHEVHKMNA